MSFLHYFSLWDRFQSWDQVLSPPSSISRHSALTLPPTLEQATTYSFQFQDYGFWGLWIRRSSWLTLEDLAGSSDVLFHQFCSLQAFALQELGKFNSVGYFMILTDFSPWFVKDRWLWFGFLWYWIHFVLFKLGFFGICTTLR